MLKTYISIAFSLFFLFVSGQEAIKSIHEIQLNEFNASGHTEAAYY